MAQKFNPFTGNFDTVLDKAEEIKYDNTTSGLTATETQSAIDEVEGRVQATEADVADLTTLSGVASNSTSLGTFTGSTITDNSTVKSAIQQLESALEGLPDPVSYKGTWDASTNSPALANTDTDKAGFLYQVSVAGSVDFGSGSIAFEIGDKVVNNGTEWQKWDMTDAVTSVNGQAGTVVLDTDDIAEGTNQYFTDERAQDAVGNSLTDSTSVDFTYDDVANTITASVIPGGVDKNSLGGGALDIDQGGTGATTANDALNALLPSQTSANQKFLTSNGTDSSWSEIQQVKNYITNANALVDTSGWATFADGASLVDGTGGTATATFTRSTSSPLRGTASFLFTPGTLGDGASYDFSIDEADKAKVLQISFDYALSGTITEGDYQVYVYDVTNSQLIQPTGYKLSGTSGTNYKATATFQTSSNSTSYRLIVWQSVSTAVTLKLDNVSVSPQVVSIGGVATGTELFTPTGNLTNATYTGSWAQVGDRLKQKVRITFTGTPAVVSWATINLKSGLSIDTTKMLGTNALFSGINGHVSSNRGGASGRLFLTYNNATSVAISYISSTSGAQSVVTNSTPFAWVSGDYIEAEFEVPIQGWQSSMRLSSETDTRVVSSYATKYSGAHATSGSWATVSSFSSGSSSHGNFDTSTGIYTVTVPGDYEVSGSVTFVANGTGGRGMRLRLNSGNTGIGDFGVGSGTFVTGLSSSGVLRNLKAGDTIFMEAYQNSGASLNYNTSADLATTLSISKISGPSQIAASESVNCRAHRNGSNATLAPNASFVKIPFNSVASPKGYDSHGVFDTTNNRYVCGTPGEYAYSATVGILSTNVGATRFLVTVYKNGVEEWRGQDMVATAASSIALTVNGSSKLVAGDYLEVYIFGAGNNSVSTLTLDGTASVSNFAIRRTGNY